MKYVANWRGTVGLVNPTSGTGSIEELTRLLPHGIGLVVTYNQTRQGTIEEFQALIANYDRQVRAFGDSPDKVDMIHVSGTPPFMLAGYEREQALIAEWGKELSIPIFTSGTNQIRAMEALGVEKFVGLGYDFEDCSIVSRYFEAAGLQPIEVRKMPGAWTDVGRLSYKDVYVAAKELFLQHRETAQGIYLQGNKWRILEVIEPLEQDLGVPVIHPVAAQAWEMQRRLEVRQRQPGYGRLLQEMPN